MQSYKTELQLTPSYSKFELIKLSCKMIDLPSDDIS